MGASTKCTGNKTVKWRFKVRCQFQSDFTGTTYTGTGSDGFECTFGVQGASVEFR